MLVLDMAVDISDFSLLQGLKPQKIQLEKHNNNALSLIVICPL